MLPVAITGLSQSCKDIVSIQPCKSYCTRFTEATAFALGCHRTSSVHPFPGSQGLKRRLAWDMFKRLQTITDATRQILTSSLVLPIEEFRAGHIKPLTASLRATLFLLEKDQSCLPSTRPSETEQTLKRACRIMPKSQDNTSQVAVSYPVI